MHSSPLHRNGEWLDIRHEIHSYHKLLLHVQSSDVTDSSHTDLSHLNPYRLQRPVRHDNHLGFLIRIAVYCEFCDTLLSSELRCCPIFGHPPDNQQMTPITGEYQHPMIHKPSMDQPCSRLTWTSYALHHLM